jgi:hypothetical protein
MRVASQLTFCSPQQILRRTVVEQDDQKVVTGIFSLDDCPVESAHTLFYDGIISAGIISLKQHVIKSSINELISGYQYIDLTETIPTEKIHRTAKPLILDFGTDSINTINSKLPLLASVLETFSAIEIIAGCTYYPPILVGLESVLAVNSKTDLLLWENIDLVNNRISDKTKIRIIS